MIAKKSMKSSFLKHISASPVSCCIPVQSKPEHLSVRQLHAAQVEVPCSCCTSVWGPKGRHKFQNRVLSLTSALGSSSDFSSSGLEGWCEAHYHRLGDWLQNCSHLLAFIKLYFIAATAVWAGHLQRIVALLRWLIAWPLASCFITPFDISYNYCLESFTTYLCYQLLQFNMPSVLPDQPLYTPRKNSPFTQISRKCPQSKEV